MVTQIDRFPAEHNQHDSMTMATNRHVSKSYETRTKFKEKGFSSTSSGHGSGQGRAKSSSSIAGSRRSIVSKYSTRPTTAASLASCVLTNGDGYRLCDDEESEEIYELSDEGHLSRCLKQWMPDYELRSLPPQPNPPRQAVFSARLGENMKIIRRSSSTESITTQLSLFSISSHGSNSAALAAAAAKQRRRSRRRLKELSEEIGGGEHDGKRSIWVELASKRGGALDKMLRVHAMYAHLDTETEIYRRLPDHEKAMVTEAGTRRGVQLGPGRQRSDSVSNIFKKIPPPKPTTLAEDVESERRLQSAGGKPRGPLTNFQELRRQLVNQRLASLQERFSRHRGSSRRSIGTKSISRLSPSSMGSNNDVYLGNTPREVTASTQDLEQIKRDVDGDDGGHDAQVSVWKGDSQILAIDLQKELTAKVKSKIASTTTALELATGYGDDNSPQSFVGPLEEYPHLVEEDYSQVARIPQRVRISPHLSDVIRTDIHVRMGRPRYHEIRMQDLVLWNRGTDLDRSHRNLKVFNWLHSLRETEFDLRMPEGVQDNPPGNEVITKDEVVVAVDEPKIKPLFERLKTERYIV